MENVYFAGKRILLASLLPDAGHLTPLLQIAVALKELGAEVRAVVPIEAQSLVSRFSIEANYLGPVIPEPGKIALSEYSKAGQLSRLFIWGPIFSQNYMLPLTANGLHRFSELVSKSRKFSPNLIIADTHLFSEEYRELAYLFDCKLILNYSKGSYYYCQNERVWSEGRSFMTLQFRTWARSVASPLHYKLSRLFFRDRLAYRKSLAKFIGERRAEYKHKLGFDSASFSILAGTAGIEKKYLGDRIKLLPIETRIYGPLDPGNTWGEDGSLREWLDSPGRSPVVYIAFGTMVTPPEKILKSLIKTLNKKGVRVLVATRERPSFLENVTSDDNDVLWKPWVPQPAVLSHPAVIAFVSHSGATSVQETLWYGKPILCLPVLWDQFYCAWFAEQLGFGVWADGTGSKRLSLETRIDKLLTDRSLRERAKFLSRELRKQDGLQNIISDIFFLLFDDIDESSEWVGFAGETLEKSQNKLLE